LLEEPADGTAGMQAHHGGARLLVMRRVRIDQARAVVPTRAPDPLAVVVDEVTTLVVDHAEQTHATVEQIDTGHGCELVPRYRIAVILGRVAHEDLGERVIRGPLDQSVAVAILPAEQLARPPAVERIALAALQRRAVNDVR